MSEKSRKVDVFLVTYTCDVCESGNMVPNGVSLIRSHGVPRYEHVCENCEDSDFFPEIYPKKVYEAVNE